MMFSDWSAGYVTDINYTHGYYYELSPSWTRFALLQGGLAAPNVSTGCELGFGQGVSIAIHATAGDVRWTGTDFNPSQALNAQALAQASGVEAELCDQSFAEYCARPDLPDFDYIALHGIWTWISDENRAIIVEFIRRKLKVGGIVYISYNTLPGWATAAPIRHLMAEAGENLSSPAGGSLARVEGALTFAEKVFATNPAYVKANPQVVERFQGLKTKNPNYLAHEYFNGNWQPMYFADMLRWMAPTKMTYAASAHLLDSVDAINLSSEQQVLLKELPDASLRETVRDYIINQQFRRDIWVKGMRRLAPMEQAAALRAQRFILRSVRANVPMAVKGPLGDAKLSEAVYVPLLDLMADHKIRSLAEIETALAATGMAFNQLVQAVVVLTGMGALALAQDAAIVSKTRKRTERFNLAMMEQAKSSNDVGYLASPVTGGGINVSRFVQLFCLGLRSGRKTPADLAEFVLQILNAQGQRITKEGVLLNTDEENRTELLAQAQVFSADQLQILKALEVA